MSEDKVKMYVEERIDSPLSARDITKTVEVMSELIKYVIERRRKYKGLFETKKVKIKVIVWGNDTEDETIVDVPYWFDENDVKRLIRKSFIVLEDFIIDIEDKLTKIIEDMMMDYYENK